MSIVVIAPSRALGHAVVGRLLAEGDEVRVLASSPEDSVRFKDAGAHVASGPLDADLVERASLGARSVVILGEAGVTPGVEGARAAGVERVVVLARDPDVARAMLYDTGLEGSDVDYLVLTTRRRRRPFRAGIDPADVAAAVSAADDLAGRPRAIVDLATPDGWRALKLAPR